MHKYIQSNERSHEQRGHLCAHIHTCTHTHMDTYIYIHIHIHTNLQIYIYIYIYICTRIHGRNTYIHMHTHTYRAMKQVIDKEGLSGLYRGLNSTLTTLFAANFIYFYAFHLLRIAISKNKVCVKYCVYISKQNIQKYNHMCMCKSEVNEVVCMSMYMYVCMCL
jgi:hypothetical protein